MTSVYTGMVRLAEHARNPLLSCQWASRQGLNLERWSIEFVNQSQDSCAPLGKTQGVAFDFKSKEQQEVVLETLETKDRVYAIRGCAGAGKTSCLRFPEPPLDRKSTRLNSSHPSISYAVFCLKKKKQHISSIT